MWHSATRVSGTTPPTHLLYSLSFFLCPGAALPMLQYRASELVRTRCAAPIADIADRRNRRTGGSARTPFQDGTHGKMGLRLGDHDVFTSSASFEGTAAEKRRWRGIYQLLHSFPRRTTVPSVNQLSTSYLASRERYASPRLASSPRPSIHCLNTMYPHKDLPRPKYMMHEPSRCAYDLQREFQRLPATSGPLTDRVPDG